MRSKRSTPKLPETVQDEHDSVRRGVASFLRKWADEIEYRRCNAFFVDWDGAQKIRFSAFGLNDHSSTEIDAAAFDSKDDK